MSADTNQHSVLDEARELIAAWDDLGPVEQMRHGAGFGDQAIALVERLIEQLDSEQRLREAAEQQYAAAEVQYGTLKEELETSERNRHMYEEAASSNKIIAERLEEQLEAARTTLRKFCAACHGDPESHGLHICGEGGFTLDTYPAKEPDA